MIYKDFQFFTLKFLAILMLYQFSAFAALNFERDKNEIELENGVEIFINNQNALKDFSDYDESKIGSSYSKQNNGYDFRLLFEDQPAQEECVSENSSSKIGGTTIDCDCKVTLFGFDADISGQMVVSGQVNTCGSNNCPIYSDFTTGTLSSAAFIQVLTNQGNNKWISNLNADSGQTITNPLFMDGNIFGISIGSKLRFFKLNGATGAKLLEQNADSFLSSNDPTLIPQLEMSADLANSLLYVRMKVNTNYFTATDHEFILIRLTPLLTVGWIFRTRGLTASPSYDTLDLFISSDKLWHLGWFYKSDTSTQRLVVQKMSKTDGSIESEQLINHVKPTNLQGMIKLNQNETSWYGLMYQDTSQYLQIYYGTTLDNSLTNSFVATWTLSNFNLEIQNVTGYMIVNGIKANNEIVFVVINPTTGVIAGQKKIVKGDASFSTPKHLTVQRGDYIYSVLNQQYTNTNLTLPRIILFKTNYYLDIEKSNCINTTSSSLGDLSVYDITGISTTSSTPTYNLVYESLTFIDSLAETTIAQQTYTAIKTYTMRDTTTNSFCDLPLVLSITNITYNFNTQSSGLITIGTLTISDCSGNQYSWNAIRKPDGTDSQSQFVQVLPSTLKFNFNSIYSFDLYTAISFRITVFNAYKSKFYYGRVVGIPKRAAYRNPSVANHDLSTCNDVVYPFYWGSSVENVITYDFKLDEWGNHMMAGEGQKVPFVVTSGNTNGFIYLGDQRGNPYWNLLLTNSLYPTKPSSCISVYQFSYFVYASCTMATEEYSNIAVVPVIVKVIHANGQLMYAKRLPVDRYDPSLNIMQHMIVSGGDQEDKNYYFVILKANNRSKKWKNFEILY
eukprot:403345645